MIIGSYPSDTDLTFCADHPAQVLSIVNKLIPEVAKGNKIIYDNTRYYLYQRTKRSNNIPWQSRKIINTILLHNIHVVGVITNVITVADILDNAKTPHLKEIVYEQKE